MHKNSTIRCPHCSKAVWLGEAEKIYPDVACKCCGATIPRAKTSGRNPDYCDSCRIAIKLESDRRSAAARRSA